MAKLERWCDALLVFVGRLACVTKGSGKSFSKLSSLRPGEPRRCAGNYQVLWVQELSLKTVEKEECGGTPGGNLCLEEGQRRAESGPGLPWKNDRKCFQTSR